MNTNAISADVSLKSSLCHLIAEMNTCVPHVVMGIRADSCLLSPVVPPLAVGIYPLHAARPPADSPEPDHLSRVLRKGEQTSV